MTGNGNELMATSLTSYYEPELKNIKKKLSELSNKQKAVLEELEKEISAFSSINTHELSAMFILVKEYHTRLQNVKKEMVLQAGRSIKLKKRALKLQEYKQKEALELAHYKEAQLKREQDLITKPNTNLKPP